eukprot:5748456-Alexandrium_andersonii.AAC.1
MLAAAVFCTFTADLPSSTTWRGRGHGRCWRHHMHQTICKCGLVQQVLEQVEVVLRVTTCARQ